MASASDPAEVELHGQREPHASSSSTDASIPAPTSAAAAAADVPPPPSSSSSPPPPPPSSVEGRTKQPGGGGRGADAASSTSAAAAVEQKGKKKISASDDREQAEGDEEERKSDSQKKKLAGRRRRRRLNLAAYQGDAKKPSDDVNLARRPGKLPWDDPRVWKPHVTPVSTVKKSLGISILVYISNKFLRRKGSPAGFSNLKYKQQPLVQHQKIPLASAPEHYGLRSGLRRIMSANLLILLNEYSDFRPEQVLDMVGTDEENRLLAAVGAIDHRQWASGFSQSHKVFEKLIQNVMRWKRRQKGVASADSRRQKLLEFFSSYSKSDGILAFLKYAAANWICSHREEYEPNIAGLGGGYTLEAWCEIYLLQPREQTDHIQMTAVAAALGVPLRVENLHNGPAQDIYTADGVNIPRVTLLYTGVHYDILYPRHPSGGSGSRSSTQRAGCFRPFW
uniref:Ubiquitinyl hydrolase 1 n=1 Tax=Oryza nivara TaxID=4536 RepID=A0A0E0G7G8_ORYNI